MKISPAQFERLPFDGFTNEIATMIITDGDLTADVITMPLDRPEMATKQGSVILLRTSDPDHVKGLRRDPSEINILLRSFFIFEGRRLSHRHIALNGVSVNLVYHDPTTGRTMGIANVPSGAFTETVQ